MMGFLNDDEGECLFGIAANIQRKKSNTVDYMKRRPPNV